MILSGAISLGAYEAGVVSQIAYTMDQWNAQLPPGRARIMVDVISGASAGAMTGSMLAAHVMNGGDPIEFVKANFNTWCSTDLGFQKQVQMRVGVDVHSFFSSSNLDAVGKRNFLPKSADSNRIRQNELIFTCALTPLKPIRYSFNALGADGQTLEMDAVTHKDGVTFSVGRPGTANQVLELPARSHRGDSGEHVSSWEELLDFAMASGAFPVAWQPMAISRYAVDYPHVESAEGNGFIRMKYTDGGVLDNMPLDRASEVLENLAGQNPDEDRIYVLIQPDPVDPAQNQTESAKAPPSRDITSPVSMVVSSLIDAYQGQSFENDLRMSQEVNTRLQVREEYLVDIIRDSIQSVPNNQVAAATAKAKSLLHRLIGDHEDIQAPTFNLDAALDRYMKRRPERKKVRGVIKELANDPGRQGLFKLRMMLTDYVSDLHDKSILQIARIKPKGALPGHLLGHFGGFIDPTIMIHDFAQGLRDACLWLNTLGADRNWLPKGSEVPCAADIPEVAQLLLPGGKAPLTWDEIPQEEKKQFFALIEARAAKLTADELNANRLESLAIEWAARVGARFLHV
ncbi:MAG TPA: patatin-like phospholipase family protein [Candidatus Xenobia bacterium]|jgi:predicted acylesterase/phospholipase RssA